MKRLVFFAALILSLSSVYPCFGQNKQSNLKGFEWLEGEWTCSLTRSYLNNQVDEYYADMSVPPSKSEINNGIDALLKKIGKNNECKVILSQNYIQYQIPFFSSSISEKHKFELRSGYNEDFGYNEECIVADGNEFNFSETTLTEDDELDIPSLWIIIDFEDEEDWIGGMNAITISFTKVSQ